MTTPDRIGFIGAGRLAQTLAPLLAARGTTVAAISSRTFEPARALAATSSRCLAHVSAQDVVDSCDLVFLTVPDDAIAEVCAGLTWRPSHAVVHCSGATELSSLAAAVRAGAQVGGFHPLQIFSDPDLARRNLAESFVALEAESTLATRLGEIAATLEMNVLRIPPGGRTAYHLGANLAASCLPAILDEAKSAWQSASLPADVVLPALLPLIHGTLDTALRVGLSRAVSGPIARGDAAVLGRHLTEARKLPRGEGLYRELLARLLALRRETRRVNPLLENALDTVISAR